MSSNGLRVLKLIHEGTTLDDIVHALAESVQRYFPVVDAQGKLVGIFSEEDVRGYLYDDTIWQIANARDVMNGNVVTVTPMTTSTQLWASSRLPTSMNCLWFLRRPAATDWYHHPKRCDYSLQLEASGARKMRRAAEVYQEPTGQA
jgi:hypothetical protein